MPSLLDQIYTCLIANDRWQLILSGLGNTLLIALCAILIGTVIGAVMALCRLSNNKILRGISLVYITVLRGIPMVTQLMLFAYVIFAPVSISKIVVAIIAFGVNSGAYMTEIMRGGIQAVDKGQMEAVSYTHLMDRLAGYPFVPQKKHTIPLWDKADQMPRATPEQEGISSCHIQSFLKDLARSKQINPHSVLILRHGKVITQAHFRPYRGDYPHMLFSLSKTFTATAVGMAVDEGILSLNDRLVDLFPDKMLPLHNPKLNAVTLRDLLTMQVGIKFNELGSVVEKDWARGFMQSDFADQPGTHFSYNSINSCLLYTSHVGI